MCAAGVRVCLSWRNVCISRSSWLLENKAIPCATPSPDRPVTEQSRATELLWELELAGKGLAHAQHKRLKALCASCSRRLWAVISCEKRGCNEIKLLRKREVAPALALALRGAVKVLWCPSCACSALCASSWDGFTGAAQILGRSPGSSRGLSRASGGSPGLVLGGGCRGSWAPWFLPPARADAQ